MATGRCALIGRGTEQLQFRAAIAVVSVSGCPDLRTVHCGIRGLPADSPEGLWYRRLNDHVRSPLAGLTHSGDPISQKTIYIYSHMFGYDRAHAIGLGLTPMSEYSYAWPPKGLDGAWPASFLYDDDGAGALPPRPSFRQPETRTAMANAVYFFMKHFEDVGAKVHLSPWREVNGYVDATRCPDEDAKCGLDTWQDLYDTYQAIVSRVGEGDFDPTRIAVYPTFQLESFIGANNRCVGAPIINGVKQFYSRNVQSDVPYAIGLSTYPASGYNGLEKQQSRLLDLLDNLDSSTPVACDANGDGVTARNEGITADSLSSSIRVPRMIPLTIGETSRPRWLTFQTQDTPSVTANEKLGATMANTHLNYRIPRDRRHAFVPTRVRGVRGWAQLGAPHGNSRHELLAHISIGNRP